MPKQDITVSGFCKNHHRTGTSFTEFLCLDDAGTQRWDILVEAVQLEWAAQREGYRDGVIIVPLNVFALFDETFFTCPVVDITPDDRFVVEYKARREGEKPRKSSKVARINKLGSPRIPSAAMWVDVVLYNRSVLEEDTERLDELNGSEWEVVTLLGKLTEGDQPMTPGTLMANHFGLDGGSSTNMDAVQFEAALRAAVIFWNGKGMLAARETAE